MWLATQVYWDIKGISHSRNTPVGVFKTKDEAADAIIYHWDKERRESPVRKDKEGVVFKSKKGLLYYDEEHMNAPVPLKEIKKEILKGVFNPTEPLFDCYGYEQASRWIMYTLEEVKVGEVTKPEKLPELEC